MSPRLLRSPVVVDPKSGLIAALAAFARCPSGGPLFEPLVVEDTGDSWGTGRGSYRKITGRFKPACPPFVVEQGPVRTITRSILAYRASRIVLDAIAYPSWPVIEIRCRVTWNEPKRRLKLAVPTSLAAPVLLAEVPGGAILRPDDGEEHVHGRWLVVEGRSGRRSEKARSRGTGPSGDGPLAVGIASSGQHGLDFHDGEIRLSVLRSSAYCHERGFDLGKGAWKFADIGVHEFRLLVTVGVPAAVTAMMPGLADHLAAPPAAYAHLPFDADKVVSAERLLDVRPASIRLLACKRSWDGKALVVRLQEAVGKKTKAELAIAVPGQGQGGKIKNPERGHVPQVHVPVVFAPFEIKTLRVEKDGTWRAVKPIEEK